MIILIQKQFYMVASRQWASILVVCSSMLPHCFCPCPQVHASILDPKVFAGLLFGSMLPYWFSAMTMKSVGKAALAMVEEVRRQFNTIAGELQVGSVPCRGAGDLDDR